MDAIMFTVHPAPPDRILIHRTEADRGIPFDQMIGNFDGNWLHQNDWSYNCIAQALCDGLAEAAVPD
jgi:hypothetical protein